MKILGIESSCDETAAAVVEDGRKILSSVISSQVAEHGKYGGVVPEIASRRHTENISSVVEEALKVAGVRLDEIDGIAVTYAPGLIGALLVGINYAKGAVLATGKPLIPVHHLRGHIAANYLAFPEFRPPFMALVVSGGHSHIIEVLSYTKFRVVGRTVDDAAGEAFDKVGRTLGLSYPGGVALDKLSVEGDPLKYQFPVPHVEGKYNFSFSGLKTAVINLAHNSEQKGEPLDIPSVAASFQNRVVGILRDKTLAAMEEYGYKTLAVAGGVAANSGLRRVLTESCADLGYGLFIPPLFLCGDNAAMIASQGFFELEEGNTADLSLNGYASMPIDEIFF